MSFKAKLIIPGREYNVLNCSYQLYQETDATGRPSSITRGGKIRVTVESTSDTSLSDWMFNNFERKDGSIAFFKRDTDAKSKELKFSEAYMVKFTEKFESTRRRPMIETFIISARIIEMGNGVYENEWV